MTLRWRLRLSMAVGLLLAPDPALADPISVAILGILGTTTATSLAISVTTFILVTAGSLLLSVLLSPKGNAQDRQASVTSLSIGEHPREAIFGEAATGGSLADAFNYGGPDQTDWEVLIIVVADHRCHSLTGFYVGDQYVAFTGDGPVAGFNGQLVVYWRDGQIDQVLPDVVRTEGGWGADDNLAGCATIVAAYKADDPKSTAPVWTSGRPSFLWVVKGKLCYIPRLDGSLEGASGSHRWNNPSTWEWTANLIDCRYNWQRGVYAGDRIDQPEMLLIGRGLSVVEAPPERTFAAANICDEAVPLKAGGTEPRYRCNAVIRANEEFIATEERFAAACAGVIVQREGGVEIAPGAARSVVAEITDADLLVDQQVRFNRFRTDIKRTNSVIPRYVEPGQKWGDHAAPVRRMLADIIADGGPREDPLTLSYVTSGTQAQRCGEIRRREARHERTATLPLSERFAHLEEGDWIGWTSARHLRGERHVFRITSYALPQSWQNTISIEEVAASSYGWDAAIDEITPGAVALQPTAPVRAVPSSDDWSVEGTTISSEDGSIPALVITGAVVGYADQVLFEYRIDGGSEADWIGADLAGPGVTHKEFTSVSAGTSYEAAVSYLVSGVPSARLVLGPVTVGALSVVGARVLDGGNAGTEA